MQQPNASTFFDVDAIETLPEWFDRVGRDVFSSYAEFKYLIRLHSDEFLKSGKYFSGSGPAPPRVGPDFGKLVIQIMQKEAVSNAVIGMNKDPPLLRSIEQTRELLACGRNSIYNLVKRKELTMIKMGRRSLITDDSIRALIDRKVAEAQHRTSLDNDPNCIKARAARSKAGAA